MMNKINEINEHSIDSTDRFGQEWKKYDQIIPEHEAQFRKWIYPLTKDDFKGKKVLDAGCGAGRNSYWALKYGAEEVIAIDYDLDTCSSARKNLSKFNNCQVIFMSIYDLPYAPISFKDYFDISFSIGVIHHLSNPQKAIDALIDATKQGGKVVIWVYGYEGNEWIVKYINPIRKITSKLPVWMTNMISYLFSIPLWGYVKLLPQNKPYMKQLSGFKFWRIHNIVLDQLIPKIAHYWTMTEAYGLMKLKNRLKNIQIFHVNDNSWTVIGTKE